MRKIPFVLTMFVVCCSLIIISCQSDTNKQQKSKTEQKKKQNKKGKKTVQKKKKLPAMNKLTPSTQNTTGYINLINDTKITKNTTKAPRIVGDTLTIYGVAIDKPRKTAAAGVYLKVGEKFYKTKYGQPNKAIAKRLKNPKYLKSNFNLKIPTAKIGKGDYEIGVFVVSADRKTYFEQKKKVKIKIR